MTADTSDLDSAHVSVFTLALLNDTGFYNVAPYFPEPMFWGYWQGCTFFQQICNALNPSTLQPLFIEFCGTIGA